MPATLLQNRDFTLGQRNIDPGTISLRGSCIRKSFQVLPDTDSDSVIGIHVFKLSASGCE